MPIPRTKPVKQPFRVVVCVPLHSPVPGGVRHRCRTLRGAFRKLPLYTDYPPRTRIRIEDHSSEFFETVVDLRVENWSEVFPNGLAAALADHEMVEFP